MLRTNKQTDDSIYRAMHRRHAIKTVSYGDGDDTGLTTGRKELNSRYSEKSLEKVER